MPAQGALCDGTPAGLELIETLRWEPGEGFVRLDRHLARLHASAQALGFPASPEAIRAALDRCEGSGRLRVRLTLARDGTAEATSMPFEPLPKEALWTLRIAETRLDSADMLLRHKTTRRQAYDAARAEYPRDEADEVLLLNERGEVCEGTITNVFIDIGEPVLVTPPLACGLLPGVLRGWLLDEAKAREALLTASDLSTARSLYVGNSLRGLIKASLRSDA